MQLFFGDNGIKVLNKNEIELIFEASFKILEKSGVRVENGEILDKLGEFGGTVDIGSQKVYFSRVFLEGYLNGLKKVEWNDRPVNFSAIAEIYQGYFLDPVDGGYKEWDEQSFFNYIKIERNLKSISGVSMLGCPLKVVPVSLQPLYEKLYCWKYGVNGGSAIWTDELCPKIYEMWEVYAGEKNTTAREIFIGTVYLISPLKFGSVEAGQFMYFYKKGLKTIVGTNGTLGGTFPVTLAGGLAVHIAENLFISILNSAFFGTNTLAISNSISVMDMSNGAQQYGRPEKSISNLACSQIARHIGAEFTGHCGLSDAKVPGFEAGVQKLMSALFNVMSCGSGYIAAGLLGVDEIFSPVQMILEDELLGALNHIGNGLEVNEDTLGLEAVDEVGAGGSFLASDHTAFNFRDSLWMPALWSKEMYNVWSTKGRKTDINKAREKYLCIISDNKHLEPQISESTEIELKKIINT